MTDMRTLHSYNSKLFSTLFGKPFGVVMLCVLLLWQGKAWGQLNVNAVNTPFTIDFSTTVTGVNNGAFNPFSAPGGTVSEVAPSAGKLNANAWHFINDGAAITSNSTFGTSQGGGRNAAFATAPGASANNATGAGWYGFNIGGTNPALGWQPDGAFATDGAVTLRLQNNTGVTITTLDIFYNVYEINNSNNSNTVRFFHSANAASWGAANEIAAMQVTSVNAEPAATINVTGTSVAAGGVVTITHASGANSAINNNDIVFLNNSVANTQLRRVSGYVTGTTLTTTTIQIDPAVGAAVASHGAGGQFTVAPVIVHTRRVSLNVSIPNGSFYFLRWYLGGTGADEMALDNIIITANPVGLQLTNSGVSTIIDFDNTLANVNNGTFTAPANISDVSPAAGQLDASSWAFVNDGAAAAPGGAAAFGGIAVGGQGVSAGGVATAGWYGFNVPDPTSIDPSATTRTLGWQSDDPFATAGMITLRMFNATGANLLDFRISFTIWENNNTNASNRVRVYISNDNTTYTLTSVTHTSVATTAATGWQGTLYTFTARTHIPALTVAPGAPFYLRFYIDHNSGTGQGDEMAIDDITIVPSATALTSINPNRDIVWAYDGFDYYNTANIVTDIDSDGINDAPFKGINTVFADFGTLPINLHQIMTSGGLTARYRRTNGYASLGWAGDWLSATAHSDIVVTRGKDAVGNPAKPTIPITSASQQRSIVNSGMYVEGGNNRTIGRRLQTSTGGYAFQYTATSTTSYQPCTSINADCPAISPLRHNNDVRCITHIRTTDNQVAGDHVYWSHTNNVRFGAEGSTVWVGVMLRKNHNNADPVFISLHRNTNVYDVGSGTNEIQIGYFGGTNADGTDSDGFRHWGVRVNGVLTKGTDVNSRITTAQMINGSITGQPAAGTPEERVFDLLVARIDFAQGTAATAANIATLKGGFDNTYASNHRVQLWVIRDIARDNVSPNADAYPPVPNPAGYSTDQGAILDYLADNILDSDGFGGDDFVQFRSVDVTIPSTVDISFHSVGYFPGAQPDASAMDELRIGGSFNQAALNSPVVSLIRGLCSANGGTLGLQAYEGGSFGSARCMETNGTVNTSLPDCPGTTTSTATNLTQERYDPASTDIWGSAVPESTLDGLWDLAAGGHPSYGTTGNNAVIRAGGATNLYVGGPRINSLSSGAYNYQLNTGSGPNDNNYLLGTQSRHSFGPAWIPFYDNSPHRNGYLMSINASYARSKFFDQTISGLCADTQYEFSIDIINVLRRTRVITNSAPYAIDPSLTWSYEGVAGAVMVATDRCDPQYEPGCQQMSRPGSSGSFIGLGSVTLNGTGPAGTTSGSGGTNREYSLNPEVEFALNDVPIYTVPISIPNDGQWHRVGLTFVTKANLAQALNLSVKNLAPGGMGNDLAIDNISFRPCGSTSTLFDQSTVCDDGSGDPDAGNVWLQINKAGLSFANARVRFQKWTPYPTPINHLVTGVSNASNAVITLPDSGSPAGTHRIPVGAIVALYDLEGMGITNGTQATVLSKTSSAITTNLNTSASPAYPTNVGVLRLVALPDALVIDITATNPITITLTGGGDAIPIGTQVTFSGVAGMTGINGVSGRVISTSPTTLVVQVAAAPGGAFNDAGGTELIELMHASDDLDNDGIPDENEWVDITFNPYNGVNYSSVGVTNFPAFYQSSFMPATPVALPRAITQFNVFYPNGTYIRAMFAGNEANLTDVSGKCRFIANGFEINCNILPAIGGRLKARNTADGIELKWNAYQERAGVKYILERSYDGQNFIEIADYSALGRPEYKHLDRAPFVGKNYYRVKIVETNSSFYYTNIATADWSEGNMITIYPNPANDNVNVVFSDDFAAENKVQIKVTTTMGSEVKNRSYELQAGTRTLAIPTADLPNGLYLLEIQIGTEKVVHKLVIKH
jgi:hypothetical protein